MNWGSVADWVSGVGTISASLVALYLAGSERRAQRQRDRPEISVDVTKVDASGWAQIRFTIQNTSHKQWRFDKAEITQPKAGLLAKESDGMVADKPWDVQFSPERRQNLASRSKAIDRSIQAVGSSRYSPTGDQPTDRMYVTLHIYVGVAPSAVSLRAFFSSLEPSPDKFSVKIERDLCQ